MATTTKDEEGAGESGSASFEHVSDRFSFPTMEREVLEFWEESDAFQKSMQMAIEEGRPEYTFYDGPPFATGMPHYGHILAGTIKDIVTRYASLTGYHVSRRFGWDCHGLPVEYEIDKKLGITGSDDVAKMGIAKYNAECRSIVTRYCSEWERIVKRMGRWIDFQNDYKTMEPWYMESVWWVFKTIFEKDLVYKGFRVMPYSTGCTTPLSNFEATSNYKDVSDPAVVVAFPLKEDPEVAFVAWTTTPWTLPSNMALCVNPEFTYVQIKDLATGKQYILAKDRLSQLYPKMLKQKAKYKGGEWEIVKEFLGKDLEGKEYEPLFPYFADWEKAFRVLVDGYVTDDSGTGIVHNAPGFGEDDYRVCMEQGVIVAGGDLPCPVDADGRFTKEITDFVGRYVKEADNDICAAVKAAGRLVNKNSIMHSYPFCWRSDTPLIYRAVPSWFVRLDPIKENLLQNNLETYWVPATVKEKRFHNWLVQARDWNISRNRYWGTPLPIWMSDDEEEIVVIGSIEELQELSGREVTDLHRESIDDITIPSKQGKGVLRRIPEVFDCWFESGSMPYAQLHYPFENKERFEKGFPADFIAEGLDQTRGWFYTLMVLSTALFSRPAMKNLIVNGLVLAEDGKKMSKRLKNYPDPMNVVESYGADALRLYLINSPVVRAEPLRFSEEGVLQNVKEIFNPWYNAYRFLTQNVARAERDNSGWTFDRSIAFETARGSQNIMDRWIQASLNGLIKFVRQEMEAYRLYTVVPRLVDFIDNLTNMYVRLNRSRLKGGMADSNEDDTKIGLYCLYTVLLSLSKLMAPFTPFFAEFLYRRLARPDDERKASVHYLSIPEVDESLIDEKMVMRMRHLREIITAGRLARGNELPLKRPLRELIIANKDQETLDDILTLKEYIEIELNVRKVSVTTDEQQFCKLSAKANGAVLGVILGKKFGPINKAVQKLSHEELAAFQESGKMTVEDVELTTDQVFLNRVVVADESKYKAKVTPSNVVVVLDTFFDKSLLYGQVAREVTSRVQKLRKAAGVKLEDVLDVYYGVEGDADAVQIVHESIQAESEYVTSVIRQRLHPVSVCPSYAPVLATNTDEVNDTQFTVILCNPCPIVAKPDALAKSLGVDAAVAQSLTSCIASMDYEWLKKEASSSLELTLDGKLYKLEAGTHYFLSVDQVP
ncbi:Isoleucine--tRNA ligase [Hondaea fermentalgiana]|uniref:isoleucine--tRNA ligase n=1 Tax=Hondaea fermentalgiana TaxID=2315210 RepID=A0A2R5G099_9STRA|nr:Isoleucine--tRNA ligase [Hondaea fermentalgiana]|eukprot:GBG23945.1 Isoleucine--tRNA ligase [Hondaea fermentalgiana]